MSCARVPYIYVCFVCHSIVCVYVFCDVMDDMIKKIGDQKESGPRVMAGQVSKNGTRKSITKHDGKHR